MKIVKSSFLRAAILMVVAGALQSCTQQFTVSANVAFDAEIRKTDAHYLVPPTKGMSIQEVNMYPLVKTAMVKAGIRLVDSPSGADYLVTYFPLTETSQITGSRYVPTTSTTTGTAYLYGSSSSNSGIATYSETTSGGTYVPYSRGLTIKCFAVRIRDKTRHLWGGNACAEDASELNASQMIEAMFADYPAARESEDISFRQPD